MINVIKFLALFMATWWSLINVSKLIRGEKIPFDNFIFQAAGITGFVWLQWLI
jgi:hypothetical protein